MDNKQYREYLQSPEWKAIARKRMEIDNNACTCCGSRGTANNPLEVHHLSYRYLYQEQGRIYEDLVTLCHVCHKGIHNIMNRKTNPQGRRGWKDNSTIPQVHVFNISGSPEQQEHIEVLNGGLTNGKFRD